MRTLLCTSALLLAAATSASAQNELFYYDGTTAFASRGASSSAEKGLIQRIPGDQVGGASEIHSHVILLQDQDVCTTEPYQLVIYGNDAAGAPTGEPDVASPIAFGNLVLDASAFCPGAFAFNVTITWTTPIALPFQDCQTPANDIYFGVRLPATTLWPATDGLACQASDTEDENPATVGYTGVAGVPGLAWDVNFTAGTKGLASSDRAWRMSTRFVDDVVQPFASNAAFGAEDPHFGYAGLFPDPTRGDQIGVQLRSSAPIGTSSWLLVSANRMPAVTSPVSGGVLCLANPIALIGPVPTAAPTGSSVSQTTFGPAPFPGVLPPGVKISVQGLTFPGPLFNLSTMATVLLP